MSKKASKVHKIGTPPAWTSSDGASVFMKNCLSVNRNGSDDPEIARITLPAQIGSEYELKVTGVALVGKMQISIEGYKRLTLNDFGTSIAKFVAKEEEVYVCVRCVASVEARGIITELTVNLV